MSKDYLRSSFAIIGLIAIYALTNHIPNSIPDINSRLPASVSASEPQVFPLDHNHTTDLSNDSFGLKKFHDKLSLHQKIKPPISVKIDKSIGEISSGQEFEITATISSTVATNDVKVEWAIPQYMEIVNGETTHTFDLIEANESKIIRLVLKSSSEENQQIHVFASAPFGKQILTAMDQFNSTDEDALKEAKSALVKRHLEYTNQN